MPHFHLHLYNQTGSIPDMEGQELADDEAARIEAVRSIRSIISAEVLNGAADLRGRIEVVRPEGEVTAVVRFTDAVRITVDG